MSAWTTVKESDAFRRLVKSGPGRSIVRSAAFQTVALRRNTARARAAVERDPGRFSDVRTFCFFVGHNKSGTSLLGGLLDAHPDVILSDEVDALQYVDAGLSREQLFHVIRRGSEAEARKGRVTARRLQPYSYAVPGQSQGISRRPFVVGDSTSGSSTRRIGERPGLVNDTRALMSNIDVKILQVVRNPFDPISVMMVRGGRSIENSIDHYFTACERLHELRAALDPDSLLAVRYETFVADPERELDRVCGFLGVRADAAYLRACASIIRPSPDRSRQMVRWTEPWIERVQERIERYDFLRGYAYAG